MKVQELLEWQESFIGASPVWISIEGFSRLEAKAEAWKEVAIEAQAYFTPRSDIWQRIEDMR